MIETSLMSALAKDLHEGKIDKQTLALVCYVQWQIREGRDPVHLTQSTVSKGIRICKKQAHRFIDKAVSAGYLILYGPSTYTLAAQWKPVTIVTGQNTQLRSGPMREVPPHLAPDPKTFKGKIETPVSNDPGYQRMMARYRKMKRELEGD